MKRALLLAFAGAFALASVACSKEQSADTQSQTETSAAKAKPDRTKADKKSEEADVGELSVDTLAGLLSKDDVKVAVLDSNSPRTRAEHGKIPGATLLSDYKEFDASELPEDKDCKLVFYCSNTHCGASHASAKVAMAEGYKDVNVLPVGIMGWKEAGQKTEAVQ